MSSQFVRAETNLEQATKTPLETPSSEVEEMPMDSLLGDWGGAKKSLLSRGVDLTILYKADATRNSTGGSERKSTYLENLEIVGIFDFQKFFGAKGLSFVVHGLGNQGGKPKEFMNDSFGTSNIQAPNTFKLFEVYLKQNIDDRFGFLIGTRDLNADFYTVLSSTSFLNSAFGISPSLSQTGANGPSIFPTTALALTFKYESPNSFYFQSGAFNATAGDPDDPRGTYINTRNENGNLYIWELGFAKSNESENYKYSIGAWTYSKVEESIDPAKDPSENFGYYILVDHSFNKTISAFLKHGIAASQVNTFASATEAGVNVNGIFFRRPNDKLLVGVAIATASNDYKLLNDSETQETVYELGYVVSIGRGITLTPDIQYVTNPGLVKSADAVTVETLRIQILF